MAAPAHNIKDVPLDTIITIRISVNEQWKKIKLPLRDLGADVLPQKIRTLLHVKPEQTLTLERFSDSAEGYITLDPNNAQVFKTLNRAARAKLKLRLKATIWPLPEQTVPKPVEMPEQKPKQTPMEPVITRTPIYTPSPRGSAAIDGRAMGSGIFQFREARASQQTLVDVTEAPVPQPFIPDNKVPITPASPEQDLKRDLVFRSREAAPAVATSSHPWSVYCNVCDVAMANIHFHCNICDGGDYDLCEKCVAEGKLCPGEGHWLIKRSIKDGKVINSTTERISPRQAKPVEPEGEVKKEVPGAFTEETKTLAEPQGPTRTCNNCVVILPEREFVTCTTCADFDLCLKCHISEKHGHHPAHAFVAAAENTVLPTAAEMLLAPGRNVRHNAICDGCDKKILGVRYKCLNCPDWDYCTDCYKSAQHIHPRHRFAPLYEPIPEPRDVFVRHTGIFCDGPLCNNKAGQKYIEGVRYKCAVCHDTDFCASCEAHPSNKHNRTHPLIKFKTPVRNVSITTENEDVFGQMRTMGDRRPASVQAETKSVSTETTPIAQTHAATQVQTVAEIKPTEQKAPQPIPVVKPEESKPTTPVKNEAVPATLLNAHFVQDTVADGTVFQPGARFTQLWTLRNPGPHAWPSGCSVRFVGGDNMLNVDNARPAAVSDIANASESNVVGRDVQVGEEVAFKVTLKAPMREGQHISYWRMKSADGTPFGHRLWCDIEVKKPQEVKPQPKAAPVAPQPIAYALAGPSQPGQPPYMQAFQQQQAQRQAIALQQQAMMQQQLMMQQAHRARQIAQVRQASNAMPSVEVAGPPPPYDASTNMTNLSARIAAMRDQQAKRREHMMQQVANSQEQAQAAAAKVPTTLSTPATVAPPAATIPSQPSAADQEIEKARKEAARMRVEHIKAKILRAREEKAKALELERLRAAAIAKEAAAKEVAEKKAAEEKAAEELEKVKKIMEEVAKTDADTKKEELENSQMVFPKLDKESPASSTYQSFTSTKAKAAYVENEEGEIERSTSPSAASPAPTAVEPAPIAHCVAEELDDDIEVLSATGEESEDDGFVTDEEYDILDASDHETVMSK